MGNALARRVAVPHHGVGALEQSEQLQIACLSERQGALSGPHERAHVVSGRPEQVRDGVGVKMAHSEGAAGRSSLQRNHVVRGRDHLHGRWDLGVDGDAVASRTRCGHCGSNASAHGEDAHARDGEHPHPVGASHGDEG